MRMRMRMMRVLLPYWVERHDVVIVVKGAKRDDWAVDARVVRGSWFLADAAIQRSSRRMTQATRMRCIWRRFIDEGILSLLTMSSRLLISLLLWHGRNKWIGCRCLGDITHYRWRWRRIKTRTRPSHAPRLIHLACEIPTMLMLILMRRRIGPRNSIARLETESAEGIDEIMFVWVSSAGSAI